MLKDYNSLNSCSLGNWFYVYSDLKKTKVVKWIFSMFDMLAGVNLLLWNGCITILQVRIEHMSKLSRLCYAFVFIS